MTGRKDLKALAAMDASEGNDGNWILVSDTSSHMTFEVDNLSNPQEYSGMNTITIGNGIGLKISHISIAMIKSYQGTKLPLTNTLCVPQLKMNIL